MKNVLFLASRGGPSTNLTNITRDTNILAEKHNFRVENDVYSNLEYSIVRDKATIITPKSQKDIKNYDLIVPINWQRTPEQATSCYLYLKKNKAKVITSEFTNFRSHSKLTEYFMLWRENLPIPNTIYSKSQNLVKMLKREHLKFPLIMKDAFKHKGARNFLVHNIDEFKSILKESTERRFIVQEFIPNKFDYRILVFGYEPKVVIKRARENEGSHLNNTSLGAKATLVPLKKMNRKVLQDAAHAAKVLKRNVAGVDIIIDSKTRKHYVLEVNYAPQIRSGMYANKKMEKFVEFLESELEK